jgi:pimeloyl-ACP methyl ester carboxylesterase
LRQWSFTQEDASHITQSTLGVLGENTAPTFRERLQLLVSWLPNAELFELPTTHLLHVENPRGMAEVLASFYARHPLTASTA